MLLTHSSSFAAMAISDRPTTMMTFFSRAFEVRYGYETRFYFNVRSKANMSQLSLPHGANN